MTMTQCGLGSAVTPTYCNISDDIIVDCKSPTTHISISMTDLCQHLFCPPHNSSNTNPTVRHTASENVEAVSSAHYTNTVCAKESLSTTMEHCGVVRLCIPPLATSANSRLRATGTGNPSMLSPSHVSCIALLCDDFDLHRRWVCGTGEGSNMDGNIHDTFGCPSLVLESVHVNDRVTCIGLLDHHHHMSPSLFENNIVTGRIPPVNNETGIWGDEMVAEVSHRKSPA